MMIVNTSELKTFLKKATLNYIINNVQIKLSKDKAISKMISSSSDAISLLNLPNLILPEMKSTDSLVMNFDEPNTNLVPFLNLINDNEETTIQIKDEKITLIQGKQKSNIFFCAPQVVSIFEAEAPRADISYFHQMEIDDDFFPVAIWRAALFVEPDLNLNIITRHRDDLARRGRRRGFTRLSLRCDRPGRP